MIRFIATGAALVLLGGCASARPAPRTTLPPDSVELLQAALARVRPGFSSQAEAIRAGVYDASRPRLAGIPAQEQPTSRRPDPVEERAVGSTSVAETPASAERPPERPRAAEAPEVRNPAPAGAPGDEPAAVDAPAAARGVRYVVQVGAFRSAEEALAESQAASNAFTGLHAEVEHADGWYRVLLRGWPDRTSAESRLKTIQVRYPDAWVRSAPVP